MKKFSFIIIPDTQDVCSMNPKKLKKMAKVITSNMEKWNIKKVLHVGDLVNNGADKEIQWKNHDKAFSLIEKANIPCLIAIGNHDYDNILNINRNAEMFNKYTNKYENKSWFGGFYEENKAENMYTMLTIYGIKFLFLSLEFGPRNEVLEWANEILEKYNDHFVIVVTHSYLYLDARRTRPESRHNPKNYRGVIEANDGEDMWDKCIKKHKNIIAVFSGHHIVDNVSYRFDRGEKGNIIFQSFQNWQCAPFGGDARFRIFSFDLDKDIINLSTFNPQTKSFEEDNGYSIDISFDVLGGIKEENLNRYFANKLDPEVEKNKW